MPKLIVCIADGAADDPSLCPEGTPLERANTPFLDSMTRHSVAGLCCTIPEGFPPDSDVGNMSLFGYDPARYHNGRAPMEAAALNISTSKNDLIWRVTFGCTQNNFITSPCASSLTEKEGEDLVAALNSACDDSSCTFVTNKAYRHLMVQKNGRILLEEHNRKCTQSGLPPLTTSGPHMLQHLPVDKELSRYPLQLQRIIKKASDALANQTSKANFLWLWGEGNAYTLPDFATTHASNACIISGIPLLHGLGNMAGMKVISHSSFTGHTDTDLTAKAKAALQFLQEPENNIAFIHVEAPDHCGHIGDADGKRKAMERIDNELLPILLGKMPDACIAVTADHLTPAATKSHAYGAVPFIAYHRDLPKQSTVLRFTENECKKGVHLSKDTLLLTMLKEQILVAMAVGKDSNLKM